MTYRRQVDYLVNMTLREPKGQIHCRWIDLSMTSIDWIMHERLFKIKSAFNFLPSLLWRQDDNAIEFFNLYQIQAFTKRFFLKIFPSLLILLRRGVRIVLKTFHLRESEKKRTLQTLCASISVQKYSLVLCEEFSVMEPDIGKELAEIC